MANADLNKLQRLALMKDDDVVGDRSLAREAILDAVSELVARRQTAEVELRHHQRLVDQLGSLKRRITELRRGFAGLAGGNCLTEVDEYKNACADELKHDDAKRRRFEKKQKAALHG